MSREVRRVPLDFDWPLNEVWEGYLMPGPLILPSCPDCKNGYSKYAEHLFDQWYGTIYFDPSATGSTPYDHETPEIRAQAERNVGRDEAFYISFHRVSSAHRAIHSESRRLATLYNGRWMHHLDQADVDALVDADRLWDFTRSFTKGVGWQTIGVAPYVTAEQVNKWSLVGMGHDSLNAGIAVEARCARDGKPSRCPSCDGSATSATDEQKDAYEAWEPTDPPTGEGWQLWETTSEGSPISPVFTTRERFVDYLVRRHGMSRRNAEAFTKAGFSVGSFAMVDGKLVDGMNAVAELGESQ